MGFLFWDCWDPRALGQEESKGILKKEKLELPAEEASVSLYHSTFSNAQAFKDKPLSSWGMKNKSLMFTHPS